MGCRASCSSKVVPIEPTWEMIVAIIEEGKQVPLVSFRKCTNQPDWVEPINGHIMYEYCAMWYPIPTMRPTTPEQKKLGLVIPPHYQKMIHDHIKDDLVSCI